MHREIPARAVARGAGNIRLDDVDVRNAQFVSQRGEVLDVFRRNADNQRRFEFRVFRHDVFNEIFDTLAGQSDRLNNAGFGLSHSRRRIAEPRLPTNGFRHQPAEPIEIDDVVILPRKRAGGGCYRILQRYVADPDRKVYHPTASCKLNTGPSRQTRLSVRTPSTSKVRTQT